EPVLGVHLQRDRRPGRRWRALPVVRPHAPARVRGGGHLRIEHHCPLARAPAAPRSARASRGGLTSGLVNAPASHQRAHLREVASLFLKLGVIAFGGPAAHIALMRQEVVERRRWLDDQEFLDLVGASNLIPGPTSTELAIYLGYMSSGSLGLLSSGLLFISPI